jgi:hypothetical protein
MKDLWIGAGEALDGRLLLAALVGALLALAGLALLRAARGLIGGRRHGPVSGATASLRRDAELIEGGLQELAREVEERLDRKLDRLEALMAEARALRVLGPSTDPARGFPAPGAPVAEQGRRVSRDDLLGEVSQVDREKVLSLAALGKRADAIAEEAGLPRGEVDLILRLQRSAERVHD